MPKSTFRIALDNNFVPTELTLPGYPFLPSYPPHVASGRFFYSVSAAVISLFSFFCVCFHGATVRTEDGLVNARDQ